MRVTSFALIGIVVGVALAIPHGSLGLMAALGVIGCGFGITLTRVTWNATDLIELARKVCLYLGAFVLARFMLQSLEIAMLYGLDIADFLLRRTPLAWREAPNEVSGPLIVLLPLVLWKQYVAKR